ncbi:MAG: ATP-dependent RecD-like DNA helicase [Parachlamydia sp.]|nr:MAG: ATP-dependent RecD-like DNA helicase [Parachlamydia sp.]
MNQVLIGYIERITFQNPETGYTVAQLQAPKNTELTCIVGIMPALQPGETIRCWGEWKRHLIHGQQFEVKRYQVEAPADILGITKYLGSGLIKGIGPKYAARIVEKFGVETLNVIDQSPEQLLGIQGLGAKRLEMIRTCWSEQKSIRDVMIFLQTHGVTPTYAQKIFKVYGAQSIDKVKANPFQLARDIFGIGFKTADVIAQKLGFDASSDMRADAGIEYVLTELASDGHVCYPVEDFIEEARSILEIDKEKIRARIFVLTEEGRVEHFKLIHAGEPTFFVWIKPLFVAEVGIAREIQRLISAAHSLREIDLAKAIEWIQGALKLELAANQKEAVGQALFQKMHIITGGPGTGKSTITKAILGITEKLTPNIVLAAPTGRAAKRMTEITGKKASTIHSLLEYDFKKRGFKRNRTSPLTCDLLIIDESSMIDTFLMYSLLKAIPDHARVIFVGDINQLPSVGPGNVLQDMIASQIMTVTTLNEIFRQAEGSRIITNAHRINRGIFPDIRNLSQSDFFFVEVEEAEGVLNQIVSLVTQRLPKKFDLHPTEEIQVLAPMRKGVIGIDNLNTVLQEKLNPNQTSILRNGRKLAVNDKVMQIRNNYQKEVFNGDIGRIIEIDLTDQQVLVRMNEREICYEFSDLDELVLAYAVSVHKYQGSECPCVVIPIHTSHFKLLYRNLLYTAVTRGKRLVVLVGTKKALAIAVHNDEIKKRYTGLQQALIELNSIPIHSAI